MRNVKGDHTEWKPLRRKSLRTFSFKLLVPPTTGETKGYLISAQSQLPVILPCIILSDTSAQYDVHVGESINQLRRVGC